MRVIKGHDLSIEIDVSPSQLSLNHLTNIIKTLSGESVLAIIKLPNVLVRDDKDVSLVRNGKKSCL